MLQNSEIADKLREIATLLDEQGANPFRVNAYRRAANTVAGLEEPIETLVERRGLDGLVDLPGIGEGIGRSIFEYIAMGRMSRLESLKASQDPVALFEQIPGIGSKLAHNIIETLHIDTLEALETAAHNGRLHAVPGFSENRVALVQTWLGRVLGYRRPRFERSEPVEEPPVSVLLKVDELYRDKAAQGSLPTIAPRRFNPSGEAWLPILHVSRDGWHFTALFSNTERAHQLGRTRDWVVIYFYDDQHNEGQHTVVTEPRGPMIGKRVVRGREAECRVLYFSDPA